MAIQDSMGWLDYHVHEFRLQPGCRREVIRIGTPEEEFSEMEIIPGWEVPITKYFTEPGDRIIYEYDFGDGWQHEVLLEGIFLKEKGSKCPRCIGGERACPPEDCGGVPGYSQLIEILADPAHPEYVDNIAWLKGHAKTYNPCKPDEFNPKSVRFDNPKKRWEAVFSQKDS